MGRSDRAAARGRREVIRDLTIAELGAVEHAAREFYEAAASLGTFDLEQFRAFWTWLIETGQGVIFVDWREGASGPEIAGAIGGMIHREPYGHDLMVEEFFWFVRPGFRGGGVALYRRFEAWARERGAARIMMVHLMDSMPEKVGRFYMAVGFAPVEIHYAKSLCAT